MRLRTHRPPAAISVIVAAIMPTRPIENPRLPNALANGAAVGTK